MSVLQRSAWYAPAVLQLNLVDGAALEDGPYALSHTFQLGGTAAHLFLAAEATGPNPQETCHALFQRLLARLEGDRRSITGRLQAALMDLHQGLLLENTRSLPPHRTTVSAACALLRPSGAAYGTRVLEDTEGSDLYVAVGGPALVWLFGEDGARDLARSPSGPGPRLGEGPEAQVWVGREGLQRGERLLLLSSRSGLGRSPERILASFWDGLEEGMAHLFAEARGLPSFGSVVVEERPWESIPPTRRTNGHLSAPRPYSYVPSLTYPPPSAGPSSPPDQPVISLSGQAQPTPAPWEGAPRLSLDLRVPVVSTRRAGGALSPHVAAALAAVALLAVTAIAFQATTQERQAQALAQAAAQFAEAQERFQRAEAATTGDDKRRLLKDATSYLDAARRQEPGNEEAAQLGDQIEAAVARLDAIHPLREPRPVLNGPAIPGSAVLFRELVEQAGSLYVLDKASDRVVQVAEAPGGTLLYQARGGAARRGLIALLSMPRGGAWPRDSIFALDDTHGLLELRPGAEPRGLPLRGGSEWGSFQAAAGFLGNLYILDPKASQVWRYTPTDTGFDTERRPVLPSVDLRDAVDLAVDGDVYVLFRTGRILKFSGARLQGFTLDGLDQPLSSQGSLFTTATHKYLYAVDQGNRRIAVFDKGDGRFLRQYPTAELGSVHSLWADEPSGRAYLATDAKVYQATLPLP